MAEAPVLELTDRQGFPVAISLLPSSLSISFTPLQKKVVRYETSLYNVLWTEFAAGTLELSFLARKKPNGPLLLFQLFGQPSAGHDGDVKTFVDTVMAKAYTGVKQRRRLRVFVNPHSGPGKAKAEYLAKAAPVFAAARCFVMLTYTTHRGHAAALAAELPVADFDAIVPVSGDGLTHEIVNGFANHKSDDVWTVPIAPVPCGSGNGLALNLLGLQDGEDIRAAALNAVKGRPMPVDLMKVKQQDREYFSFMSQTVGLLADLDLGTEHLRFLGSARFVIGYLRGIIQRKPCPVKLSIQVAETDKTQMVRDLHASRAQARLAQLPPSSHSAASPVDPSALPTSPTSQSPPSPTPSSSATLSPQVSSPKPSTNSDSTRVSERGRGAPDFADGKKAAADGWITLDRPLMYMFAGKGPYVSRDFMQFPVSVPNDGLVDVVAQEMISRKGMFDCISVAPHGGSYWLPTQHYFKARAFRVEPYASSGNFSVDGEGYPFAPFEVEVCRGMATMLSPCGFYQAEFDLPGVLGDEKGEDGRCLSGCL